MLLRVTQDEVQPHGRLPLDDLLVLLELEPLEVNLFRGLSPDEDRQRVFGGQVAAQALVAAGRTVEADRPVHSLHAYFLRPGDPTVPIVYEVDRIRDGKSFTTRRVVAHPARRARSSTCGVVPDRRGRARPPARRCRTSPAPTSSRRSRSGIEPYLDRFGAGLRRLARARSGRSTRGRSRTRTGSTRARARRSRTCGSSANGTLPDDPLIHACVVAYASDLTLLDTAMLPHAIGVQDGEATRSPASTTRCGSTARSAPTTGCCTTRRARRRPARAASRSVDVFSRDGTLAITVIQEGLIRPLRDRP